MEDHTLKCAHIMNQISALKLENDFTFGGKCHIDSTTDFNTNWIKNAPLRPVQLFTQAQALQPDVSVSQVPISALVFLRHSSSSRLRIRGSARRSSREKGNEGEDTEQHTERKEDEEKAEAEERAENEEDEEGLLEDLEDLLRLELQASAACSGDHVAGKARHTIRANAKTDWNVLGGAFL